MSEFKFYFSFLLYFNDVEEKTDKRIIFLKLKLVKVLTKMLIFSAILFIVN